MMISEFCAFSFLYRKYVLNESANFDVTTTRDAPSSPEFLPPDAKVQKLAIKDKTGSAKTRGCEELESSQASSTTKDKVAGEKLSSIKEHEDKIAELLVTLESDLARGRNKIKQNKTKEKNVSQKFGKGENALFLTLYALTSVKVFSILFPYVL